MLPRMRLLAASLCAAAAAGCVGPPPTAKQADPSGGSGVWQLQATKPPPYKAVAGSDSEVVPDDLPTPQDLPAPAEPFYGDVGEDRVRLASRLLGLPTPTVLGRAEAVALLDDARQLAAAAAVGRSGQARQLADQVARLLAVDGPAVPADLDLAPLLVTARADLAQLADHVGVELPAQPGLLTAAARDLVVASDVPDGLDLPVGLARAHQRRQFDLLADELAGHVGQGTQVDVSTVAGGHVLLAQVAVVVDGQPVRLWAAGLHPADPALELVASDPRRLLTVPDHVAADPGEVVVAVNGGFWTSGPDPDGLLVVDGLLRSDTSSGKTWVRNVRPSVGWTAASASVGTPTWTLQLSTPSAGAVPINGFDRRVARPGDLVASLGGPPPGAQPDQTTAFDVDPDVLLASGSTPVHEAAPGSVPAGGQVRVHVAGGPVAVLREHVANGQQLTLTVQVTDGFEHLSGAIAGGPSLRYGGEPTSEAAWRREGFGTAHTDRRHPRTIVGVDRFGNVVLLAVDGRRPGWSAGLTQGQSDRLAAAFGLVDAIHLDGGGSTTFFADGTVGNRPSDGRPRPVATALLVRAR